MVACASNGDLFCRECAVSDLLAQRQEIKRLEKEWEREKSEQQEAESQRDTEAKEQELKDFEATMAGYGEKRKRSEYAGGGYNSRDKKRRATEQGIGEEKVGHILSSTSFAVTEHRNIDINEITIILDTRSNTII